MTLKGLPHHRQEAGMGGPHWWRPAPRHHTGGSCGGAKPRWQGPNFWCTIGGAPLAIMFPWPGQPTGPTSLLSLLPLHFPTALPQHTTFVILYVTPKLAETHTKIASSLPCLPLLHLHAICNPLHSQPALLPKRLYRLPLAFESGDWGGSQHSLQQTLHPTPVSENRWAHLPFLTNVAHQPPH